MPNPTSIVFYYKKFLYTAGMKKETFQAFPRILGSSYI